MLGLVQSLRHTQRSRAAEMHLAVLVCSPVVARGHCTPNPRTAVLVRIFPYLWVKHTRFASFLDDATESYSDIPGFVPRGPVSRSDQHNTVQYPTCHLWVDHVAKLPVLD